MAYKTADLLQKAIEAAKKHQLIFIEEVVSFLPCAKKTFYEHKLHESNDLKAIIEQNKDNIKADLRKKWAKQKNATTEIALYKLAASQEERKILSNSDVTLDTGGNQIQIILQKRETSKD